jgi:hypothetical protein
VVVAATAAAVVVDAAHRRAGRVAGPGVTATGTAQGAAPQAWLETTGADVFL